MAEVRSELVKETNNAGSRAGFSTVTLKLNPEEYARALEVEQKQGKEKQRALSLPVGGNGGNGWREQRPSASSALADSNPIKTNSEASSLSESPGPHLAEDDGVSTPPSSSDATAGCESDEFYEDDFEDDIGDWKRGDSIGSGSYGTVRSMLSFAPVCVCIAPLTDEPGAQVYLARDERTGGLMAVKEILIEDENDADISSATKEVDLLRSLRDDHVVRYIGSYVDLEAKKLFIFTVSGRCRFSLDRTTS